MHAPRFHGPLTALLLGLSAVASSGGVPAPASPGTGARIEGSVMGLSGRPMGGASVILRYSTRLRPGYVHQAAAVADGEGRFTFAGLPADAAEAHVAAWMPGKDLATAAEGVAADPAPGAPRTLAVLEPRRIVRVRFRVPEGLPPAEGAVALEGGGPWIPFAAGEALLTLPPAASGAPAAPAGVKYHSELYGGGVFFTAPGTKGTDTAIDLARPDWVEGKALDPANVPAAGVLYRAENAFRGMLSMTGPDGTFRVRRLRAGALQVHFRDPRFRDTSLALPRDAGKRPLEVRLDRGASPIAGRIASPPAGPRAALGNVPDTHFPSCLAEARPLDARRPASAGRPRWAGGEIRRAVPGPDGSFRLEGLEPAAYRVRVDCPAASPAEDTAAPGALLAFAAPSLGRPVEGRVLDASTGAPLPAFRLAAGGVRPDGPETALPDAEDIADSLGRFRLPRGFRGATWLCAAAAGYAPACRAVAEGDTLPAEIRLEKGFALRVSALGAGPGGDTAALAGARVRVRRVGAKGAGRSGETDAEGIFLAEGLARGEYAVDVREGDRMPWRGLVEVSTAGPAEAVARLAPGQAIAGTLLAWDGRPPRGLRVLARPDWPSGPGCPAAIAESPVRPDGSFALQGLGGCPATLGVAAAWSRSAPFLPLWRLDGQRPGGAPLELRLPRSRPWEITAVSGGRVLPVDAEIHLLVPSLSDSLPGEALGHPLGRAPFRGTYTVNAYEGVRYVAVVGARGYRERADTVVIPAGEDAFESRLELAPWPGARGRLAFPKGAGAPPLPGWSARIPGGATVPLEPDGSFVLEGIPPGPAAVEIRDGEGRLAASGTVLGGGPEAAVAPAGEALEWAGRAVDASGRPAAGACVVLRRREFPGEVARAVADGEGRFSFRAPPGAWLACPEDAALPCTRLPADPAKASAAVVRASRDNAKATVTLKLPLPLPMRGGAALVGPWGAVQPAEARDGELLHPHLSFPGIPGRGALVAAAYAPSPAIQWWAAEPWDSPVLEVPPPGPGVQISASDAEGRPVRGAVVRFLPREASKGRPWGEAEGWRPPAPVLSGTDAAGALHCLGVHPGRYWVYASHASLACAPVAWDHARSAASAISLVLAPGLPVRVRVSYAGHPVSGARVEVYDSLGNRAAPAAWAQRDGDLIECGAFPPGRYRVAAAAPGLGRLVSDAVLAPGGGANLEASLPAAGWLELTGEGLGERGYYLKDRNNQVTSLVRQAEAPPLDGQGRPGGSLLFHGIPPETYQVWMEGGREGLGEVEIRPAGLTVLEVGKPARLRVALPARRG